jgi:hypothetical protein
MSEIIDCKPVATIRRDLIVCVKSFGRFVEIITNLKTRNSNRGKALVQLQEMYKCCRIFSFIRQKNIF